MSLPEVTIQSSGRHFPHSAPPPPAPHPLGVLGVDGLDGGQISFLLVFSFFTFPTPHVTLLASQRRLILRNISDLGLENLKLINCLFEGVESDKKSEGMPGLTDPKPPRCLDGLKDERVIPPSWGGIQSSGDPCCRQGRDFTKLNYWFG